MKKYVLLGGYEISEAGFFSSSMKAIKKVIQDFNEITFLVSRFHTIEKNSTDVERILSWFKYHGINFNKHKIIDNRLLLNEQKEVLKNSKNIFINGGDTLAQMSTFNKNGLTELLKNFNGSVIGISAGAINMGKRSILPITKFRTKSYDYKGIGVVNVTITPHFDINNTNYIKSEVLPLSYRDIIYGLDEDGAILIIDDIIEFYGNVYKIKNGTIEQIQT